MTSKSDAKQETGSTAIATGMDEGLERARDVAKVLQLLKAQWNDGGTWVPRHYRSCICISLSLIALSGVYPVLMSDICYIPYHYRYSR